MSFYVILAAALTVASASPSGFLRDTPEVQAAKQQFVLAYNRMARLAAEAPDDVPNQKAHLNQPRSNPISAQNFYSFSASLGGNQQFFPQTQFRAPVVQHAIPRAPVHHPNVIQPAPAKPAAPTFHFQPAQAPRVPDFTPWNGPFADTIPAGLHGLPVQVTPTPEVQAARDAHLRALQTAYNKVLSRSTKLL